MKIGNLFSNVSTWINTVIGIIAILLPTGISYTFFRENFLEIILVLQLLLIIYLLFKLYQYRKINSRPNIRVKNNELFNEFYDREIKLVSQRSEQLQNGYFQLFSDELERLQTEIIYYISNKNQPSLFATDITNKPEILLTRNSYFDKNKHFIKGGGTLKRILLVPDESLSDYKYINNLLKVINKNKEYGVQLGMLPTSILKKNQLQDFIIYDKFCVLVEGLQADASYAHGMSTLYFSDYMYDHYELIFEDLWNNVSQPQHVLQIFENSIILQADESISFDYSEFIEKIKKY